MKNLISIIIPVFNAEKTIAKCLDSILVQTYPNFEIVIINDGSKDHSEKICLKYADKDKRIKYYFQKNKGVSAARNNGLTHAKGDYLFFVDADDWLESQALNVLISYMSPDTDIVMGNILYEENGKQRLGVLRPSLIRKADFPSYPLSVMMPEVSVYYDNIYHSHDILGAACGKLIRHALIKDNHICFNEDLVMCEDCLFYLQCFNHVRDFAIISEPIYHYVISGVSAISKPRMNMDDLNVAFFNSFVEISHQIPDRFRNEFILFLRYRCYVNLVTKCVANSANRISFVRQVQLLKHYLKRDIYRIEGRIPQSISKIKQCEMYCLKNKLYLCLLLINVLRNLKVHK